MSRLGVFIGSREEANGLAIERQCVVEVFLRGSRKVFWLRVSSGYKDNVRL